MTEIRDENVEKTRTNVADAMRILTLKQTESTSPRIVLLTTCKSICDCTILSFVFSKT